MKLETKRRWKITNTSISGALTSMVAAMRRGQSAPLSALASRPRPMGKVRTVSLLVTSNGHM